MSREELIVAAQNESKNIEATKGATKEEETILNFLDWFKTKDNGSYATYDDAVELIKSNKNPETWLKIKTDLANRAQTDLDSKYTTGVDIELAKNTIFDVRKKVAQDDVELAKTLNRSSIIENYSNINKYLDTEDIFKIEGINPDEGAPSDARISMSFSGLGGNNEKAIKNAILYSLPEDQQKKYYSLNYKGPDVHVQLKEFADGKKRAIFKIPTELGGDNQYRLFNEPGEWKKDVQGFTADIPIILADLVAGYYTAAGGPNAVALSTGMTNAVGEYFKMKIGQDYYNQNQDMTDMDMMQQAIVLGGIAGGATKLMFPVMNQAKRIYLTMKSSLGLGEGALSRKIIKDFVNSYKEGAGKNLDNDQLLKEMKDQLMLPKDQGGLGLNELDANKFIKQNLGNTDPTTIVGQTAKELSTSPVTGDTFLGFGKAKVKKSAINEVKKISEMNLDMQKKLISDITGIDVTKLSELNLTGEAYKKIQAIANERYTSNLIKQQNFTEKFVNEWKDYSKKYIGAIQPEEANFNKVFTEIIGDIQTNNFARSNNLNSQLNNILGNVTVTIPKTNVKQVSPSKLMTDAINDITKFSKFAKQNLLNETDLKNLGDAKVALNGLKAQFKTNSKMSALDVMSALDNIEKLKAYYPQISSNLTALQSSLRSAMNKAKASMPDSGKNLLEQQFKFIENNRMTKDGVIGEMISKLGGTKGPVVKFKGMVSNDMFDTLFGNSQSQIQALKYIKSGLDGGLSKDRSDVLKTIMHNKYIDFVTTSTSKNPTKDFLTKYGNAYKQIFSPKEMRAFINVTKSKQALEKIVTGQLNTSQIAKNVFPTLKNVDISNMNFYTISQALLDPTNTPRQVKTFFNTVSKSEGGEQAVKSIKANYLKTIFDQFKTQDPVLMRKTLDGEKFFTWLSNVENEQVFTNMFGESATKNMKVIAAQMNLMQNFPKYVNSNLSEAAQAKMRETATRMVYGPLSHENVLIKGAIFFLNQFDQKLGKELFDYDFFIEKFKNSYMAKYAPALNDKKFMGLFNTYDAGTKQSLYTTINTTLGLGVKEEQKGSALADTGLPVFDFGEAAELAQGTIIEPVAKNISKSVDVILGNIEKTNLKKKKEDTLKKMRELKDE
jgi:hypothetical protein